MKWLSIFRASCVFTPVPVSRAVIRISERLLEAGIGEIMQIFHRSTELPNVVRSSI